MKRKVKKIISIFMIINVFPSLFGNISVKAEDMPQYSKKVIYDNDGNEVLSITMEKGIITIKAISSAATTNVRWETVGITVTRDKVDPNGAKAKDMTGPAPVKEAFDDGYAVLPFSEAKSKTDVKNGDVVITTVIFDEDKVTENFKSKLSKIEENTPLYLHCIFSTYKKVGNEKIPRKSNIANWEDIVNEENWGSDTLHDFKKYFNMEILYKPAPQPNSLYFIAEDGTKLKIATNDNGEDTNKIELASIKPGKQVSWSTSEVPETIVYKDKTYDIYGYYVKTKLDPGEIIQQAYLGEMNSGMQNIRNGETDVWIGGMNVYVLYRVRAAAKIVINAVDQDKPSNIIKNLLPMTDIKGGARFNQPEWTILPTLISPDGSLFKRTAFYTFVYTDMLGNVSKRSGLMPSEYYQFQLDIPIDIKAGSTLAVSIYYKKNNTGDIPIDIIAIDKSTNKEIQSLGTDSISGGEKYSNSTSILDNIKTSTTSYSFNGSWDWSYTSSSSSSVVKKTGSGSTISFTAPSADKIKDGITIKAYYDKDNTQTGDVTLRVIMVGSTGKTITELSTEKTAPGKAVTKTASDEKSVDGIIYKYMNKWDYDYTTSSGTTTKNGTGYTAAFTIPTNTKLGSTVTLRLYYDYKSPDVKVPDQLDPITKDIDTPSPYAVINGDKYGSSYFTSEQGISTTESQYVYVKTKDYLLGYKLSNKTGKVTYYVPVTMHYTVKYKSATPSKYGTAKDIIEKVDDTQRIKVERAYSYWEITQLQYYNIDTAKVYNYSLPDGSVSLTADNKYFKLHSISTMHSEDMKDHVLDPKQVKEGIEVTAEPIVSDKAVRPTIEYEDLTKYAVNQTDEAQVKNDYLMFNGSVIMDNEKNDKIAPIPDVSALQQCTTICEDKALYTDNKIIDAMKENGIYSSNGNVTYRINSQSINAYDSERQYNVSANNVQIHTPVICDPVVTADNDKWTQLIDPVDGAIQMVLDPSTGLNDFNVKISNTLKHSDRLGYYNRDFSRSFIDPSNVSYIANTNGILRNEMKLPFDVYYDIFDDNNENNDQYIKAGTWIVLGRATARLYVPLWVKEGTYTALYRTIAVNGTDKLDTTEETRNSNINNYVATSKQVFQISGRVYGLTIYDISDYPKWQDVFRKEDTMLLKAFEGYPDGTKRIGYDKNLSYYYTVGTRNQYGETTGRYGKYTFPLVNGDHPKYENLGALKTGYAVRFMLDTTGEMYSNASYIKITPTFYYVDADGKNRQQVDLYYNEEINGKVYNLVKVGADIDLVNINSGVTGNIYSRIPENQLKLTANVTNTDYSILANQHSTMYSYSQIKMLPPFRTFIGANYASKIAGSSSYIDVRNGTGLDQTSLSKFMQRWYGTYKIPTDVHAVTTGFDVYEYMKKHGIDYSENFWLKDGYIIVNFDIVTIDDKGKQNLSYINANNYLNNNNCSMWVTEEAPLQKTDYKSNKFNWMAGDFIMYFGNKKSSQDYEGNLY